MEERQFHSSTRVQNCLVPPLVNVNAYLVTFTCTYITACMKQLCTCTNDVIYGCRNITRVNATSAVCRDPSGELLIQCCPTFMTLRAP